MFLLETTADAKTGSLCFKFLGANIQTCQTRHQLFFPFLHDAGVFDPSPLSCSFGIGDIVVGHHKINKQTVPVSLTSERAVSFVVRASSRATRVVYPGSRSAQLQTTT